MRAAFAISRENFDRSMEQDAFIEDEPPAPRAPTLVMVDDREMSAGVVTALRLLPDVEVQIKRLLVGDYVVDNRCVFERKTVLDFAASVMDGRLFNQAQKLAHSTVPAAFILEGRASDLTACRVSRESLQGAMVSLSLIFRLPVLRSMDAGETAKLLLYASQQIWRHEQDYAFRSGRRPKNRRRRQLRILQGLPGVGPDRAVRLLNAFGSVEAVMTADPDCLAGVEGIGTKTASAIRQVLSESPIPYGVKLPKITDL